MEYTDVYIGLGTNLGERKENLKKAVDLIARDVGAVEMQSPVFETEPLGLIEQPLFLNQVIRVSTILSPEVLLSTINDLEKEMGRLKTVKWGPRIIDIDILIYGNIIYRSESLVIPHPEMHKRMFVLKPLSAIASDLIHPVFQHSIDLLMKKCGDDSKVLRYLS